MMEKVMSTTTAQNGLLWAGFGGEMMGVLFDLRWMLLAIVMMVVADFWLGVRESLDRNVEFRFSRAGRRTTAKLIEYLTYLLIGAILGMAIAEPLGVCDHVATAAIGLSLAMIWELDSIVGHTCAIHGVKNHLSVKRALIRLLKKKNEDVGEFVEDVIGEETNTEE